MVIIFPRGGKLMKYNTLKIPHGLIVVIFAWLCLSCAVAHYGSILLDVGAEKDFEAMHMDPGMNYYYSGSDALPNAIVGLNKAYTIQPDLWKPVENEKTFAEQIKAMRLRAQRWTLPRGFLIRDDKGNAIGAWYSLLHGRTYVKMGNDQEVNIGTPEMNLYEEHEIDKSVPLRMK
jgi:hypothetical protein